MAFTLWGTYWGDFWGGKIDDLPVHTIEGFLPSLGEVDTGRLFLMGSIWKALDDAGPGATTSRLEVTGGDSIGRAPGNLDAFRQSGDFTVFTYLDPTSANVAKIVKSTSDGASTLVANIGFQAKLVHGELFTNSNIDPTHDNKPGFLFVGENTGSPPAFYYGHVSLEDESTYLTGDFWDNELNADISECRLVTLPGHGTVLVAVGNSAAFPGQKSFFLKSSATANSQTATEIIVDLTLGSGLEVDLTRYHVVELRNGQFNFYYRVFDPVSSIESTAFFSYQPLHEGFSDTLPFSTNGVTTPPSIILNNYVPIVSVKGGRRHPVTNEILLGFVLGAEKDTDRIDWFAARGLGTFLDPVPLTWNSETFPHLFGGQLKDAAPDSLVGINSVGWAGTHMSASFPLVGNLVLGGIGTDDINFHNFYRPDKNNNQTAPRLLLGELYGIRRTGEACPEGVNIFRANHSSPLFTEATKMRGYDLGKDFFGAVSALKLQDLSSPLVASIGPNATANNNVIPSVGIIKSGQSFVADDSQVVIPGDASLDGDGITISFWVYLELSSAPAIRTILYKNGSVSSTAFKISWDEINQEFIFQVKGGAIFVASPIAPITENRWYHLSVTYDSVSGAIKLYLFGSLISSGNAGAGGPSHIAASDIVFGSTSSLAPGLNSFRGIIEDFAYSTSTADDFEIARAYAWGLTNVDGPVMVSRSLNAAKSDFAAMTTCVTSTENLEEWFTFSARNVAIAGHSELTDQVVIDVWRNFRNSGAPIYEGCYPIHPSIMDWASVIVAGKARRPVLNKVNTSLEMKVTTPDADKEYYVYTPLFAHDPGNSDKFILFRTKMENASVESVSVADQEIVIDVTPADPNDFVSTYGIVETSAGIYTFVAVANITGAPHRVYVVRPGDAGVGAFTSSPYIEVADMMPFAANRFGAASYVTGYSATPAVSPVLHGIIGRELEAGMGWHSSNYDDIQLIFGLGSANGGTSIPFPNDDVIVSTCAITLPRAAIDAAAPGAQISITDKATQLDEYGFGGVEPFIPIDFISPQAGVTGDTLILGRSGVRSSNQANKSGNSGLSLFRIKREWNWSVIPVANMGMFYGSTHDYRTGASMCVSLGDGISSEQVQVHVCRPMQDRNDKFSTVVMDSDEFTDVGHTSLSIKTFNSVLRRSDNVPVPTWLDYSVHTRNFTDRGTGAVTFNGNSFSVTPILRWSNPGNITGGGITL